MKKAEPEPKQKKRVSPEKAEPQALEPSPKKYDHYRRRTPKKPEVMSSMSDSEEEVRAKVKSNKKVVDSSSSED